MNSEEIHTEGLPVFCVVSTRDAVSVMCTKLQKVHVPYMSSVPPFLFFCLCLGLIYVSVLILSVSGKKLYSLDTSHKLLQLCIFSSTNTAIIMSNIVQYSMDVPRSF